ncbi:MAG TPA: exosome complex RNA-binding protein Csl4 [Candidatus Bathyarchaeia archaeon]|jgi:exosome complex component CSL4|nr:exosome complex RNA-binding protein Csl4 [Candidatus Bathyarchaeia archaeon]
MGSKSEQKTGQLVLPGERLGVIEEFVPDAGTFVKDGVIYSKVVGRALHDLATRRVSVHQVGRQPLIPQVGSIVMGQVAGGQSDSVKVRIFQIGDKQISTVFVGVLHVSDANIRYVDSMHDVCKAGDIVRARVISDKNQVYHLSTKDRELGVIYAFCSNCGGTLEPTRQGMHCPKCGRIEERKTTADYGKDLI